MDYVTRQFIFLAKKFRKELHTFQETLHRDLVRVSDNIKNLKGTVGANQKTADESNNAPPVTKADPRTDVPISVKTYAQHSVKEQIWRVAKSILEVAVGIAVIGYTALTWQVWQEQIDATNFSARQTEISRKTFAESAKNFRTEQRPYLTTEPRGGTSLPDGKMGVIVVNGNEIAFAASVDLRNVGKSPAIEIANTPSEYKIGPAKETTQAAISYVPHYPASGHSIAFGDVTITPTSDVRKLTKTQLTLLQAGTWRAYVVGGVQYRDIFSPRISPYETTYCFEFKPTGLPFGNCRFPEGSFGTAMK